MNQFSSRLTTAVAGILRAVEKEGDRAVARCLQRFDKVSLRPADFPVPREAWQAALRRLPTDRRRFLAEAAGRIRRFHQWEKSQGGASWSRHSQGVTLGQQVSAVETAGVYVPGGRFAYPSSVLMAAVPARVAGVRRVVVCTPPKHLTDEVMAACALAPVDDLFQVGGPAAVAAMAFGTRTIPRVDVVVGPGGAWVTEAKRQVFGRVGIDGLAGPSEIVVWADESAVPAWVAADLEAQAEHDPAARATLLSTQTSLLKAVRGLVDARYLKQCRFQKVKDETAAVARINALAPEHLSLALSKPERFLKNIRHAGAIFLGSWTPVAAGDYWAGPSHVLPTAGSARFASGLSVKTFQKESSVIGFSPQGFRRGALCIQTFAQAEGLTRHARSVQVREAGRP